MKQVDEIIYDAICADAALMEAIGNRVVSTCFEVSPTEQDNTPLPNIIVTDDGFQNLESTKDELWDGCEGLVHVSQLAHERVKAFKEIIKLNDELGYDIYVLVSRGGERLNDSPSTYLGQKDEIGTPGEGSAEAPAP